MRNARLSERQKELGLFIVEDNNKTFVETMRGVARMLARKKGAITSDDLQDWFSENRHKVPAPKHQNAWGAIFKSSEWRAVGYTKSERVERKGGVIRLWVLK